MEIVSLFVVFEKQANHECHVMVQFFYVTQFFGK